MQRLRKGDAQAAKPIMLSSLTFDVVLEQQSKLQPEQGKSFSWTYCDWLGEGSDDQGPNLQRNARHVAQEVDRPLWILSTHG